MKSTSLKQLSDWCGGALIQGVPSVESCSISTDSRSLEAGQVFLALKGDKFDGHKFLKDADEKGVACVIVQDLPEESESISCGIIHVRDTLKALQDIAAGYRRSRKDDLFVVGVTGSNGKTSTKDFLLGVTSQLGSANATKGNLNNHIGLPLTALSTEPEHQTGVWEMGMNHPGEIDPLAAIAAPNAAVITNIGTAHIEHMKTQEAIADEKGCLAEVVGPDGFCAMPGDDPYFDHIAKKVRCRMIPVGFEKGEVTASNVRSEAGGMIFDLHLEGGAGKTVRLPVRGRHMVSNAMLAAAVGKEMGLSIEQIVAGLEGAELTSGRLTEKEIRGIQFLDDSYNANPDSMRAALSVLSEAEITGKRVAVLGFMGELGEHEETEHHNLGKVVSEKGIDYLVTVGEKASRIHLGSSRVLEGGNFTEHEEAANYLREILEPGDLVLVKGSRSAGMEKVIKAFET